MALQKFILREQVHEEICNKIVDGTLPAGTNINESALAAELGVSRTPLREGLLHAEADGLVVSRINRGFYVAQLDPGKVCEIYPVLAALESLAVTMAGERARQAVPKLKKFNEMLAETTSSVRKQYRLDQQFHDELVAASGNQTLIDATRRLRRMAGVFDGAMRRGTAEHNKTCTQHQAVVTALENGANELAAAKIREHWEAGIVTVEQWIKNQNRQQETN